MHLMTCFDSSALPLFNDGVKTRLPALDVRELSGSVNLVRTRVGRFRRSVFEFILRGCSEIHNKLSENGCLQFA